MVDEQGRVKIIDFAMAEKLESEDSEIEIKHPKNKSYVAPEIETRRRCSMASDWWAVGVIIYELVLGNKPFTKSYNIANEKLIFPNTNRKPHSNNFRDLVEKLLCPLPRLANADEILAHPWFSEKAEYQ